MNALMLLVVASEFAVGQNVLPEVRVEATARPDMVIKWNDVVLEAIRQDRTPPPVAARNLAIVHISIYDAVMAIERTHQPYLCDIEAPKGVSVEAAVAVAAHRALIGLYPKQREALDAAIARCWNELPRTEAREKGGELGRYVADRVLEARRDDGFDKAGGKFSYKTKAGYWLPTAPGFQDALLPEWGYVKPFAIKKGTQHQPPGPPALSSQAFGDAYHEVRRLGSKHSQARTEEQTQIAYFWEDNAGTCTPPGHWNMIAQTIAMGRGHTLIENARLFAHLNISLHDAGVLCWVIKFTFEFWRPITAIRAADRDEKWTPLLQTPPFPAYVSGHSTFSAAAASVLAHSIGTDKVNFITTSDSLPGVTRKFTSLWSAAEEAGMSRIYGGIHWQFDNIDGLQVGGNLGEYVYRNTLQPRRNVQRPSLYPPIIKGN
jgi:membrane-associated phospholipid phosphatase